MEYWASFAVINIAVIFSMHFIQNYKINFKDIKIYILYIISTLLLIANFEIVPQTYRIIVNTLIYMIFAHLFFKKGLKVSILLGVYMIISTVVAEIIYAFLSYNFISHEMFLINNAVKVLLDNLFISLILFILNYFLGKKEMFAKILFNLKKIKSKQMVVFSLLLVVIFNFFMWFVYLVFDEMYESTSLTFIGSIISLFSVILVFTYLRTNNKFVDISEKYDISLENIRNYEQIIDSNRVNNHEIRNQFLMLRNMSKNKQMTSYIDSILNNKLNDSEELLNEVVRIPSGGLRGLIYTKLLSMREQKINYELYVDKKINVRKINKIDSDCMVDICKIIGVFLDNAIDAVKDLKEKNITVELYSDRNDIVISITNNFSGFIDVEKLDKVGYTTKSEGHGYGLRLVNDILSKNDKLENYKELYEDNFTQNLKIKM